MKPKEYEVSPREFPETEFRDLLESGYGYLEDDESYEVIALEFATWAWCRALEVAASQPSDSERLRLAVLAMWKASAELHRIGDVCGDDNSPAGNQADDVGDDLDEILKAIGSLDGSSK